MQKQSKSSRKKTMIIDADTHISPTGGDFAVEKHMERMARAGIDKTLVWLRPDYEGTEIEGHNRYIYDAVRKYPDKLIGFGWTDPTVGVEHALKMVKVCTEEYSFYGVKMKPLKPISASAAKTSCYDDSLRQGDHPGGSPHGIWGRWIVFFRGRRADLR